ncbi:MAG: hypothetical protein KME17_12810 [Cyanosarcina radialis HA8281-LM2]|jgi:hypothetical protein|nr:hypothetical protein [Cyanosarcina radialis HA8281-LM2]
MLTLKTTFPSNSKLSQTYPTIFYCFLAIASFAVDLSNCLPSQAQTQVLSSDLKTEVAVPLDTNISENFNQAPSPSPHSEPLVELNHSPASNNEIDKSLVRKASPQENRSSATSEVAQNSLPTETSNQSPAQRSTESVNSDLPETPESNLDEEKQSSEYIIPPTVVPEEKLKNTQFTTIPLNNTIINHTTRWELEPSIVDGTIGVSALYRIEGKVTQSISANNVFTSEQTGTYLQTLPFAQKRTTELVRKDPSTTIGFRLRTSLIGDCALIGKAEAGNWCTLVPGLRFDESSYDPKLLIPTKIIQTSKLGDPVSDEIAASMFQPGFQDSQFALDLYMPNAGSVAGNSQTNRSTITRDESTTTVQPFGLTEIDRVFKSNATQQVIGQNRRGFWLIPGDPNFALNSGVQALARVVPKANPNLAGSAGKPRTDINLNLYQAANNFYIPDNSLTVASYEQGRADNPRQNRRHPTAEYNGIWIGLSPVGDRSVTSENFLVPTGSEVTVLSAGAEGGIDSNVVPVALIDGNLVSFNGQIYSQAYVDIVQRDVDSVTKIRDTRTYEYFPSLAYSYNRTNSNQSMRLMAGMIFSDRVNAYLGADYTKNWKNLSLSATGRYYSESDLDYPSQIGLRLATPLTVGKNSRINLFINSNYVFDGAETEFGTVLRPNVLSVGFNAKFGDFNLGATQYISGILPDSAYGTQVNLGIKLGKIFTLSAAAGTINDNITYGIKGGIILSDKPNASILEIGFQRRIIDYDEDVFGHKLQATTDDSQFKLGIRYSY